MMQNALYRGSIEHRRFAPVANAFTYSVGYYFLDLSKVQEVFTGRFFGTFNKPGILSFWSRNYLTTDVVREEILKTTGRVSLGPVYILTNPTYFGYCFNPVSFYYCYGEDAETLEFVVSEITNTPWGEKHRQVFEMDEKHKKHFMFPKAFHVSPFMQMGIDYTWVFETPSDALYVLMQNRETAGKTVVFDSTLRLEREELNMVRAFLRFPFVTFKTTLAIHYQALKLYLKRAPFYNHPTKGNA